MYNAKSSFTYYLRNTILPLLPVGTNLYANKNVDTVYPAVFVSYPFGEKGPIDQGERLFVQFDVVTDSYNSSEVDKLVDALRDALNVKSGNGGTTILYNSADPDNLIAIGFIKWNLASYPKERGSKVPGLEIRIFELYLTYETQEN